MKSISILIYTYFLSLNCISQNVKTDSICNSIKYDTIRTNLIVEINASNYYQEFDAVLQQDNFFFDHNFNKTTLSTMYNSDTILISYWDEGVKFYKNKLKCLNLGSISKFYALIDYRTISKNMLKRYNKSIFKNEDGIEYLRISAKVVTINVGKASWLIPKIYTLNPKDGDKFNLYCKRIFNNTLILADIISWEFR